MFSSCVSSYTYSFSTVFSGAPKIIKHLDDRYDLLVINGTNNWINSDKIAEH